MAFFETDFKFGDSCLGKTSSTIKMEHSDVVVFDSFFSGKNLILMRLISAFKEYPKLDSCFWFKG